MTFFLSYDLKPLLKPPMSVKIANAAMSAITIVAPTGVFTRIEIRIPTAAQHTDRHAEQTVTDLKLLNTRMAESAGKIMSAEISSEPTRFIAITMMTAMIIAIIRLYTCVFIPVAREKFSSKVTAKILL